MREHALAVDHCHPPLPFPGPAFQQTLSARAGLGFPGLGLSPVASSAISSPAPGCLMEETEQFAGRP